MSKPILLVIAGCNGAGKSSFSKELAPVGLIPFDYDKIFLGHYNSLIQSDFQDVMAHNMAYDELQKSISTAIKNGLNFCYETNFNSDPFHWPQVFREAGYELNLIYFCLDSLDEAVKRVQIRVENGGHHVPKNEIEKRYFEGFKNLNELFNKFDNVHLLDASFFNSKPKHILSFANQKEYVLTSFPKFLKKLLPNIYELIKGNDFVKL